MYNFSIGQNSKNDKYSYGIGRNEDKDVQVPSYMAKTKKSNGFGGISSLNKKLSNEQNQENLYGSKYDEDEYDEYDQYEKEEELDQYYEQDYGKEYLYKNETKSFGAKQKKDIIPKRFALKYDPPTIVMEYLIPSNGKLYHHKMKILKLKYDTVNEDAVDYLKKKHFQYFQNGLIDDKQLEALIEKLKKKLKINSNKVAQQKNSTLENKDKQISKQTNKYSYNYDEEIDYDVDDDQEYNPSKYQNFNLNKLSSQELQKHKSIMEKTFQKNFIKPGDDAYNYEIEKDFQPEQSNDWDADL